MLLLSSADFFSNFFFQRILSATHSVKLLEYNWNLIRPDVTSVLILIQLFDTVIIFMKKSLKTQCIEF